MAVEGTLQITISNQLPNSVPDTNTFSLGDVVTVVQPSAENSLSACFNEADSGLFDATYSGSKDRLSNFRNYGG